MKNTLEIQGKAYADWEQIGIYPLGTSDVNKPNIWVNKHTNKPSQISWNQGFCSSAEDCQKFVEGLQIAIKKAKEPLQMKICEGIVIDKHQKLFRVAVTKLGTEHVPAKNSWSTDIRQEDTIWSSPGLDGKRKLEIGSRVEFYFCSGD